MVPGNPPFIVESDGRYLPWPPSPEQRAHNEAILAEVRRRLDNDDA
jgi:hypothetical protein